MSVYFAEACGYIKIGYSKDPFARAATITRTGKRPGDVLFKSDVDLLGWIPGDQWRETELHGRFTDNRVAGEWFRLDRDEICALIWDDPRGVDLNRMSAIAAYICFAHPHLTRDQLEAAGVQVIASPLGEAFPELTAQFEALIARQVGAA